MLIQCVKNLQNLNTTYIMSTNAEIASKGDPIELPSEDFAQGAGVYGCRKVLSTYCGFNHIPWQGKLVTAGDNWQHGWLPSYYNVHPELTMGVNGDTYRHREEWRFFVARKDQENYLRENGYKDVHAIGLPFVYATFPPIKKIDGTLLVLPVHSIDETHHDRQFEDYASYIKSISDRFSKVYVCIHPSDFRKGYWVNEFLKQGIPFVTGANYRDANALNRMRALFSAFEFVTSNGFGSHLAYASFSGAKASISGPYEEDKFEDYENSTFKKNSPEAFRCVFELTRRKIIEKNFPSFFRDPWEATPQIDWAKEQLGFFNIKGPSSTRKLVGWDARSRIVESFLGKIRLLGKAN
jgi:hypothetical protein